MGNDAILWISFSDTSVTGRQTRAVKWREKEGNKTLKTLKTSGKKKIHNTKALLLGAYIVKVFHLYC